MLGCPRAAILLPTFPIPMQTLPRGFLPHPFLPTSRRGLPANPCTQPPVGALASRVPLPLMEHALCWPKARTELGRESPHYLCCREQVLELLAC